MENRMTQQDADLQADKDVHVRNHFDRLTRAYLLSVLSDELIEEHRLSDGGHFSEPLARLLIWCQRRPLTDQYAIKAEADGTFRVIRFAGRRSQRKATYVGEERHRTLRDARHGVFLHHISDLTEK